MRLIFWKALVGLLAFDLVVLLGDFPAMYRIVRAWKIKQKPVFDEEVTAYVCDAVNRACALYPKRALCLQRSAVTTCLLRSCGQSAKLVMGAQKLPFKAHAWVEVEGRAVNERANVQAIYNVWERC